MWKAFLYHGSGGHRTTFRSYASWALSRSSGMVTSTFAHGANFASPELPLFLRCIIFILCVRMFCWQVYLCTIYLQCSQRPEEGDRSLDPLELELRDNGFSLRVGAGNLWILCRTNKCF